MELNGLSHAIDTLDDTLEGADQGSMPKLKRDLHDNILKFDIAILRYI